MSKENLRFGPSEALTRTEYEKYVATYDRRPTDDPISIYVEDPSLSESPELPANNFWQNTYPVNRFE